MRKQCNLYNLEAEFKKYLQKNNFSRTSVNNYLADLRHFLSWLILMLRKQNLAFEIAYLNSKTFALYKKHLQKAKTPTKTINRRLSTLRTFIRFCLLQGWLTSNPLKEINNIKIGLFSLISAKIKKRASILFPLFLGLFLFLAVISLPAFLVTRNLSLSKQDVNLLSTDLSGLIKSLTTKAEASTSAGLLTIPIIDARGNLNLTASYPKIIGYQGTLTLEAPSLKLQTVKNGNLTLNTENGALNLIFEGKKPPLPYDSVFNFLGKNLKSGSLIYGQTETTHESVRLLELVSGSPAQTRFSVDAKGNVHIKGNLILEGNLIINPDSRIFSTLSQLTATSSASPETATSSASQ